MISVYRLSSAKFPVKSGFGAALYGGRWNFIGHEAIYAAESRALAALEVLVHYSILPRDFQITRISIPPEVTTGRLDEASLPLGWNSEEISAATQGIGTRWIESGTSAVLDVPSSIIPEERNYILNGLHPQFQLLQFGLPVPFRFDTRLK